MSTALTAVTVPAAAAAGVRAGGANVRGYTMAKQSAAGAGARIVLDPAACPGNGGVAAEETVETVEAVD